MRWILVLQKFDQSLLNQLASANFVRPHLSGTLECIEQRSEGFAVRGVLEQHVHSGIHVRLNRRHLLDASDNPVDQCREVRVVSCFFSKAADQAVLDVEAERLTPPLRMIGIDCLNALGEAHRESVTFLSRAFVDRFFA